MRAFRLENGNLLIPRRAEGENGLIGDGMVEIGPDSPEYEEWQPWVEPLPEEWARPRSKDLQERHDND